MVTLIPVSKLKGASFIVAIATVGPNANDFFNKCRCSVFVTTALYFISFINEGSVWWSPLLKSALLIAEHAEERAPHR